VSCADHAGQQVRAQSTAINRRREGYVLAARTAPKGTRPQLRRVEDDKRDLSCHPNDFQLTRATAAPGLEPTVDGDGLLRLPEIRGPPLCSRLASR